MLSFGQIFSFTPQPREVSSIAEVSTASWTPSTDPTRLPEVRYNLRAIVDHSVSEIDRLAREARKGRIRQQAIREEDARLKKRVTEEAERMSSLSYISFSTDFFVYHLRVFVLTLAVAQ